ncbi:MAG: radical SAM/SPASM domain-containing protein [Magnetococcales bacterium]|nr:radical SAM/SPASM domain-containing protein [Magnetococcales bacterium]
MNVEVVRGCQLACVGCPNAVLKPKVRCMEVADFVRYMANVDVVRVANLRLYAFGDPLLHPHLSDILARIPILGFQVETVEVSTNAQHTHWDDLTRAMATGVLTQLVVSCDGDGSPEDFERLRPPARWDKLLRFLHQARELRDRLQPGLRLMTRTIATEPAHWERWRTLLRPLGWEPEFRTWIPLPQSSLAPKEPSAGGPRGLCAFQRTDDRLHVDWDGTVLPCCAHPRAGNLGNLGEERFTSIYRGDRRAGFLMKMLQSRATMPICNVCEAY